MTQKKLMNVRITEAEDEILTAYAKAMGQTKTEVVRTLIRSLEKQLRILQRQPS
jgi:Ribbon-helix-helix protein, copG family